VRIIPKVWSVNGTPKGDGIAIMLHMAVTAVIMGIRVRVLFVRISVSSSYFK
jgi:hypothetical protein